MSTAMNRDNDNNVHNTDTNIPTINWSSHFIIDSTDATGSLDQGDKINLPQIVLEQLLQQVGGVNGTLPSPLTFELKNHQSTDKIIHAGVREFSLANNSLIQLPRWMIESLALQPGDRVLVKLAVLPKGTFARLKPVSDAFFKNITDYRAALEAHLRQHYQTLTVNQPLSCRYGGDTYHFKVMELKPQEAVSIIDTDLEVDLDPIESATSLSVMNSNSTQTHSTSTKIGMNEKVSNVILAHKGEYKYWKLHLPQPQQHKSIAIRMNVENGDADIVISRDTTVLPTLQYHDKADMSSEKEKLVKITDLPPAAATAGDNRFKFQVGVHGYADNTTISWEAIELDEDAMDVDSSQKEVNENQQEDLTGRVQCPNCRAWILERTFVLHEGFCLRNNVLCPWGCGAVFKKDSDEFKEHWHCDQCEAIGASTLAQQKHIEYEHTDKPCICTQYTARSYTVLAEHRRTSCPEKMIICRYCHILTPQGVPSLDARDRLLGLHSHESYCGSRTITCQKCHKAIPIKDIQVHAKIHEVKRQQQTLPPVCLNRNCIRPRANNKLGFCQYCFGPFWIMEDDPKNAKLYQRVARKLHAQLTVGCGHAWCRNKYCATANKDPKDATTAASLLIPILKHLPKHLNLIKMSSFSVPVESSELYLCVDESTTRKKFLAEILYNDTEGKYDFGWCVKALEHEQEDLDRGRTWLDKNSPYRQT